MTELIFLLVGALLGGVISYLVRAILSKKKQEVDNHNSCIKQLEETIRLMSKEAVEFVDYYTKLNIDNPPIKKISTQNGISFNKVSSKKAIHNFVETKRLLMQARHRNLRRCCQTIKNNKPTFYPIPSDKLKSINMAIEMIFEKNPQGGLPQLLVSLDDLYVHYEIQSSF